MSTNKFFAALLIIFICALPFQISAQGQVRTVIINSIDESGFPEVSLLVQAIDQNGLPVQNLGISDFEILEDGNPVSNPTIAVQEEGIVIHVLVDAGSTLINSSGDPRWNRAKTIVTEIAQNRPVMRNGQDIMSLQIVEPGGVLDLAIDKTDGSEIVSAVQQFDPSIPTESFANMIEATDQALDDLSISPQYQGKSKAIIILSGDLQITRGSDDLINKATDLNIPLYTVLLKPNPGTFSLSLQELADGSGGQFTPFSDTASLTGIANQLDLSRVQYQLKYDSTSATSGSRLVQVTSGTGSDRGSYDIEVGPPRVLILDPTDGTEIKRESSEFTTQLDLVDPASQLVTAEVSTTPNRRLTVARLLVNGDVVASINNPPSKSLTFDWDLRRDQRLGTTSYRVEVEVEDILGMTGRSPVTNVDVRLIVPEEVNTEAEATRAAEQAALNAQATEVALLATQIVEATPVPQFSCDLTESVGNELLCNTERTIRGNWIALLAILASLVAIVFVASSRSAPAEAIRTTLTDVGVRLTKQFRQTDPRGYLVVVDGDGANIGRQLPIFGTTPIGRSREHAQLLFHQNNNESPISRLHCTIVDEEDHFLLRDEGSTHGTYINGMRIPTHQPTVMLNDGDEIELALVEQGGLRLIFQLAESEDFEEFRQTGQDMTDIVGNSQISRGRENTIIDDSDLLDDTYFDDGDRF